MPAVKVKALGTGDYSIEEFEDEVAIERKSVADLFHSFGKGRERFQREAERMKSLTYAAVVVEGDWLQILRNPPVLSQMSPKSILASAVAWEQRYGISFWMCPNRAFAERLTYRILERFYRDKISGMN